MDVLNALNEQQRLAATADNGPLLIIAGPGTGKTKTLTARVVHLLESGQANPSEIIALTFTNKAAREMRERLRSIVKNKKLPKICTFHALGADLLKQNGNDRKLITESERREIIGTLARPQAFKCLSLRELNLIISRAKTSLGAPPDTATSRLLKHYEAALAEQGLHDYDDLLCKSYDLLQSDGNKRPNYRYVLVDEFQDTSELQYELLKLLGAHENICAIGDPNQSIYAFRGAGAAMFEKFRDDFPAVQEVDLIINYRSRPEIVTLANAIFPDSLQLTAQTKTTGKIQALQTLNEYSEAAYVINEIERGIGGSDFLKAHADAPANQPRDYAVLYRTRAAARALQKAFAESGIPYQIAGEGSPYEQPEIQTIITELRVTDAVGKLAVCDLATQIAEKQGVSLEKLMPFFGMLVQFGTDIEACLKHIDEIAEQEFYDPSVNAVALMTIHASKGLEFDHVFLIAAEEGILPSIHRGSESNFDEEHRLFYVATTRAKKNLDILYTQARASQLAKPSRFVEALPEATLSRTLDPDMEALQKRFKKRALKRAQTTLL